MKKDRPTREVGMIEDGVEVPESALLKLQDDGGYGGVEGLADEELADPAELERQIYVAEWGPILALPCTGFDGGIRPLIDECGRLDWGAFGTWDYERLRGPFDKAGYKADKLQEQLRWALIMFGIVQERLSVQARVEVVARIRTEVDLDDFEDMNEYSYARWYLRARTHKAEATCRRLVALFPGARVCARVERVDERAASRLRRFKPDVLLCATDNAASRLALQQAGRSLGLPTVLGATDSNGCDVYVQEVEGPSLDDQNFGAISRAAETEAERRRRRGCDATPIFVTPGLVAGALMAHRLVQIREGYRGLLPIRWRGGGVMKEQGRWISDESIDNGTGLV